jgi:hypothetical protein
MSLTTTSATPVMPKNRGSGNKAMKDWQESPAPVEDVIQGNKGQGTIKRVS